MQVLLSPLLEHLHMLAFNILRGIHVNFCPWSHDWRSLQWMEMDLHVSSRLKISAPRICFKATEAEAVLYNDARQYYGCGVPNQVS